MRFSTFLEFDGWHIACPATGKPRRPTGGGNISNRVGRREAGRSGVLVSGMGRGGVLFEMLEESLTSAFAGENVFLATPRSMTRGGKEGSLETELARERGFGTPSGLEGGAAGRAKDDEAYRGRQLSWIEAARPMRSNRLRGP